MSDSLLRLIRVFSDPETEIVFTINLLLWRERASSREIIMCGFAGVLNLGGLSGNKESRRDELAGMGRQLARRGPDDEQFYDDGLLSLVFRRLSVIDIDGGRQPIWNEDQTIVTVVNGEIYNHAELRSGLGGRHRFSSHSDSEVIVHLYEEHGADLTDSLNGMFAFAVWDTRNRRLLLARDRLGIKPLFYTVVGDTLIFASELKALLAHPDCPRIFNWLDLERGHGSFDRAPTYIRDVHHLPGGHFLLVEPGRSPALSRYWSLRDSMPRPGGTIASMSETDYLDRYGELLRDSVKKRLMSDVPVGLFLSGGIDSTLLAAMAAQQRQDLHCFTVVEDSTLRAGDVEEAQKATMQLGLPFYPVQYETETLLDELQFDLGYFEYLIWALDTPRFSVEWLLKHELHRYAKSRIPDLKVMLLGQGADEFTGGYSQTWGRENQTWSMYQERMVGIHDDIRRLDAGIPAYLYPALAKRYPPDDQRPGIAEFHSQMEMRTVFLQTYNLWHEDRTSSSQGVEARVPFLDHRLVELLASVPEEMHDRLFFNKHIVRHQLQQALPTYPPEKLKVKFYDAGENTAIARLRLAMARRLYPDFRASYLEADDAIFSTAQLDEFYHHATSGQAVSNQDLDDFFECMSISVFIRLCGMLHTTQPPVGVSPPSPLQAWSS